MLESLQEELDYYPLLYTREQNEWFDKGLKRALRIVKTFPTADVVPKSEVEELKAIIADHKASECEWEKLYANSKTEVAREIFEEIDKLAKEGGVIWTNYASAVLAGLKKKYTEAKND